MAIEKLKPSFHFEAERIEQLKQIAPEAFADGKIIWENLQEALGDFIDDENANTEHFGLFWPGKREARKIASTPSLGTLIPCAGEGVDEETTNNIFIEGDNLEVLKLLQKSYANQIKMIYIDPPYNTGNDFIYDDNFTESIDEYLRRTGQVDEEAKPISANTRADGRFHSKWLSMMYPRLRLARNLMTIDGVMFISIDDNELHNLIQLCNEVFGEENFMGTLTWLKKRKGSFLSKEMISVTEYIVAYKKSTDFGYLYGGKPNAEESQPIVKRTNGISSLKIPSKVVKTKLKDGLFKKGKYGLGTSSIILENDINVKDGLIINEFILTGPFTWSQPYLDNQLKNGAQLIINTINFQLRAFKANDDNAFKGLSSIINGVEISATNEDAYEYLVKVFGDLKVFDYSKPVNLIKYLINSATYFNSNSIVLDFFAGSGTIAQAVYEYNIESQSNLTYIAVQLGELINKPEINEKSIYSISDIAKKRIKYSIESLKSKNKDNLYDLGFKVYSLQHSNYKPWKNYTGTDINELEDLFENNNSPLVDDWKPENLLSEIQLIEGFPLDSKIEKLDTYKKNQIKVVSSAFCEHKLLVCLDNEIDDDTIKTLQLADNDVFICLDTAISDKDKVTLQDKGLIKTI